jgi:hypothetical protein
MLASRREIPSDRRAVVAQCSITSGATVDEIETGVEERR